MITMALLLICPHCQTKIALSWQTCPACRGNLRNLPRQDRRYFVYGPASGMVAPPVPEAVTVPHGQREEKERLDSHPEAQEFQVSLQGEKDVSLCEALDRILNKGAVLLGEVMVSVADVDLVYLGLQVILASVETARGYKPGLGEGHSGPNLSGQGA